MRLGRRLSRFCRRFRRSAEEGRPPDHAGSFMRCPADAAGGTALRSRSADDGLRSLHRWSRRGRWMAIFQGLVQAIPKDDRSIDSHRSGSRRGRLAERGATARAVGCAAAGRPRSTPSARQGAALRFPLTPGHWADVTAAYDLTAQLPARAPDRRYRLRRAEASSGSGVPRHCHCDSDPSDPKTPMADRSGSLQAAQSRRTDVQSPQGFSTDRSR